MSVLAKLSSSLRLALSHPSSSLSTWYQSQDSWLSFPLQSAFTRRHKSKGTAAGAILQSAGTSGHLGNDQLDPCEESPNGSVMEASKWRLNQPKGECTMAAQNGSKMKGSSDAPGVQKIWTDCCCLDVLCMIPTGNRDVLCAKASMLLQNVPPALLVHFLKKHRSEWADYGVDAYSAACLKAGPYAVRCLRIGGFSSSQVILPLAHTVGGMESVLEELKMEVIVPLYHPQLPQWLGVRPMAGILLYGPPGCGKTKLAHAIANETGVPFYKISATEVVSGVSSASEENIRELFSKAYRTAPSIVFIDEIDAISSKRENLQREIERRIVTQLMTCTDESHRLVQPSDENSKSDATDSRVGYLLVIGAINRPDAVDPALRRSGRFDREIVLGVPEEYALHV